MPEGPAVPKCPSSMVMVVPCGNALWDAFIYLADSNSKFNESNNCQFERAAETAKQVCQWSCVIFHCRSFANFENKNAIN